MTPRAPRALLLAVSCLLLATAPAGAQSLGELLEQAIYTEDTIGDLDVAARLYRRVIAEGANRQALAARALHRLGRLHLGRGQRAEAEAALRRLIEDYPDQTALVARARRVLMDALRLARAPWADGEVLELAVKLATGVRIGSFIFMTDRTRRQGRAVWRLRTLRYLHNRRSRGLSVVHALVNGLRPLDSSFRHQRLGHVLARYERGRVLTMVAGQGEPRPYDLDGPCFDNEQAVQLLRCLPLAAGYEVMLPIFSSFGSGPSEMGVVVGAPVRVTVPAGEFECWPVEVACVKQTFWIGTEPSRPVVRLRAGGITCDLVRRRRTRDAAPNRFDDEVLGCGLTLPADWHVLREPDADRTLFHLIDPDLTATTRMIVRARAHLGLGPDATPADVVGRDRADLRRRRVGYRVRPDSQVPVRVAGHPAVRLLADFSEDGRPMVELRTTLLGPTQAIVFTSTVGPDDLAAYRPRIARVIESFQPRRRE